MVKFNVQNMKAVAPNALLNMGIRKEDMKTNVTTFRSKGHINRPKNEINKKADQVMSCFSHFLSTA